MVPFVLWQAYETFQEAREERDKTEGEGEEMAGSESS